MKVIRDEPKGKVMYPTIIKNYDESKPILHLDFYTLLRKHGFVNTSKFHYVYETFDDYAWIRRIELSKMGTPEEEQSWQIYAYVYSGTGRPHTLPRR